MKRNGIGWAVFFLVLFSSFCAGAQSGFSIRGTKGWLWRPEQYLATIPTLADHGMNFMMICYGSMCDIEHFAWGSPDCNRWWEPLSEAKRKGFERVLRECQKRNIDLCLSMNPNLFSRRIFNYASAEDFDALWQHYDWMQKLGMKWFCISLDDISQGIDAAGQAKLVNTMLARLREKDPAAQLIFCPTRYWGDGTDADTKAYLEVLARDLNPDVYLFWTGDAVITPKITRKAAESYRGLARHRLIVWDNYPVNDGNPTMHLGPVTGRDPDLDAVCDGYMSNPMHTEDDINVLPLMTCADYARDPQGYNPVDSIERAIARVGRTPTQQETLRELVALYPGMLIFGEGTACNPCMARLDELLARPKGNFLANLYIEHVESVATRLEKDFGGRFAHAALTLEQNIGAMRRTFMKAQER